MHRSIWQDVKMPAFERLEGEKKTDVLIIGGGLCGVLCAYYLKQAGVDCLLCEGERIGVGTSGNTTGKVTFLNGFIYDKLMRDSRQKAEMYLAAGKAALAEYAALAQQYDFDFERLPAYSYSLNDRLAAQREAAALNRLGVSADFTLCSQLPFKVRGGVGVKEQGQLHPLKFLAEISQDLPIYEHSFVYEVTPWGARLNHGTVHAKNIIVCTHFPFVDRYGMFFLKQFQHRSYVLALEGAGKMEGMYVDAAGDGYSFRPYGDKLLFGGGGHRTGTKGGFDKLQRAAKEFFPKAKITARWAAQDCMTLDHIPYVGLYSPKTPNLFVATGFNKWGLTGSMAAALCLSEMVQGKKKDWAEVFTPQRSIWHKQLLVNALTTTGNLLMPLPRRCTHLGCALHYNRAEHSWDCACHGSRFDQKGRVINNPATRNLKH